MFAARRQALALAENVLLVAAPWSLVVLWPKSGELKLTEDRAEDLAVAVLSGGEQLLLLQL